MVFEWAACLLLWLIVFPEDDGSGKAWVRKQSQDALSERDSVRELVLNEWLNRIGEKMFEPSGRTKNWLWKWNEGTFTFWTDSPDVCFLIYFRITGLRVCRVHPATDTYSFMSNNSNFCTLDSVLEARSTKIIFLDTYFKISLNFLLTCNFTLKENGWIFFWIKIFILWPFYSLLPF